MWTNLFWYNLRDDQIYTVTIKNKNKSNIKCDLNQLQFKLDTVKLFWLKKIIYQNTKT